MQGSNRINNRIVLIVGILCAALAFGGVLLLLRSGNGGAGATTQVVVAKAPITAGTPLSAELVATAALPADRIPADAYTDPAQVVGKVVVVDVSVNSPILPGNTAAAGGGAGGAAGATSGTAATGRLLVDKGEVALAIPTSTTVQGGISGTSGDLLSVGYYIQAGDHIDMLIDGGNGTVRYAFQDVVVLRAGTAAGGGAAGASAFIVELPRNQAEQLAYLVTHSIPNQPQLIKYLLRPRDEYGTGGKAKYEDAAPGTTIPNVNDAGANAGTFNSIFPH